MKLGAAILGLCGAIAALVSGTFFMFASEVVGSIKASGLVTADPATIKILAMIVAIPALLAGGILFAYPLIGGILFFITVELMAFTMGFTSVTFAPIMLMAVASNLAVLCAQRERATPIIFLGFSIHQYLALQIMVMLITVSPFVLYPVFLMKVLCFALFACAFNLLIGYVGLLSFGHAAYFGMGGYAAGYAAKAWGWSPELAMLFGMAAGGLLGIVFGWLAIRRQGIYFAMITLALGQMAYFFCLQAPFTGGEDGIQQIPRGKLFGLISLQSDMAMYAVVAVVFLAGFLLIHRIVHSPFGQILKAIRENEPRATSLGYRTDSYKLVAFIISCALAGLAGGTKSLVFGIATLTDVHNAMSGEVVLMTLLGGLGTIFGPVMGALIATAMENYLAQAGAWVTVIQGAIFIACVIAFRKGVLGVLAEKLKIQL